MTTATQNLKTAILEEVTCRSCPAALPVLVECYGPQVLDLLWTMDEIRLVALGRGIAAWEQETGLSRDGCLYRGEQWWVEAVAAYSEQGRPESPLTGDTGEYGRPPFE